MSSLMRLRQTLLFVLIRKMEKIICPMCYTHDCDSCVIHRGLVADMERYNLTIKPNSLHS